MKQVRDWFANWFGRVNVEPRSDYGSIDMDFDDHEPDRHREALDSISDRLENIEAELASIRESLDSRSNAWVVFLVVGMIILLIKACS